MVLTGDVWVGLIGIDTNNWTINAWWPIIEWCRETFGDETFGVEWFYTEDYNMYLREDHLVLFALRWC